MSQEKIKKPNAGHFKKKIVQEIARSEVDQATVSNYAESLHEESVSKSEQDVPPPERPAVDMAGLIRDLVFNRYHHIMEKEAKPIAEKMVREGSHTLHEVKWFLAHSERVQLAKELAQKHGLS